MSASGNNSSYNGWSRGNYFSLLSYTAYTLEGSFMFFGNMSVAIAIWKFRALRANKGYFVFSFMFFCDSLNGLAQLFAAIYRTSLLFQGIHDVLISRWECMCKLHTYVWAFSEPCAAIMLAVISFDRVMLVWDPGQYFKSNLISYISICIPFVWSGCGVVTAFVLAYLSPRKPSVAQYCLLSFGLGKSYWLYHGFLSVFGSGLSISLYVAVIFFKKKRLRDENQTNKQILKGQQKLTKSLGISCLVTLFVFLIPRLIGTSLDYVPGLDRKTVSVLMMLFYWIIGNFNSVINLFIFLRIRTIRRGVKALWTCQQMPADLKLWHGGTTTNAPPTITYKAPRAKAGLAPVENRVPQQAWDGEAEGDKGPRRAWDNEAEEDSDD